MVTRKVAVEATPRGQCACNGTAIQPTRVQLRDKAPDLMDRELVERGITGKRDQRFDIAPVVKVGMSGQPPLMRQVREVLFEVTLCDCCRHTRWRAMAADIKSPSRVRNKVPMSG